MALSAKDLLGQDEFWIFLFALGVVLLNWPAMALAYSGPTIFGWPSTLVYIITVWLLIVAAAYAFDRWHP